MNDKLRTRSPTAVTATKAALPEADEAAKKENKFPFFDPLGGA